MSPAVMQLDDEGQVAWWPSPTPVGPATTDTLACWTVTRGIASARVLDLGGADDRELQVPEDPRIAPLVRSSLRAQLLRAALGAPTASDTIVLRAGQDRLDLDTLLRSHLPAGTLALLYAEREGRLTLRLADARGSRPPIPLAADIQQLDAALRAVIDAMGVRRSAAARAPIHPTRGLAPATDQAPPPPLGPTLAALTDALLPASIRPELAQAQHLVIVPTGVVGITPFAMLQPLGRPLIRDATVTIVPSLDVLLATAPEPGSLAGALVVGDPTPIDVGRWHFPRLPGAAEEAREVGRILGVTPLIGKRATTKRVVARAKTAPLLYFATHGVSDPEDPMQGSFLALAGSQEGDPWTAEQILSSPLEHADLAVLSACQTGLGRAHPGGVIGLARAFYLAGVPRTVVSLWNVDDAATRDLMLAFMRALNAGAEPRDALRTAMLEMSGSPESPGPHPDPAAWAPFQLFGIP